MQSVGGRIIQLFTSYPKVACYSKIGHHQIHNPGLTRCQEFDDIKFHTGKQSAMFKLGIFSRGNKADSNDPSLKITNRSGSACVATSWDSEARRGLSNKADFQTKFGSFLASTSITSLDEMQHGRFSGYLQDTVLMDA